MKKSAFIAAVTDAVFDASTAPIPPDIELGIRQDIELGVNTILETIQKAILDGTKVELRKFARFSTKETSAKNSRNPRTGKKVYIGQHRKLIFKPSKDLLKFLNGGDK